MPNTRKQVLTIAGSDSGGGAGIQADIKAMSANGVFAMSVICSTVPDKIIAALNEFEYRGRGGAWPLPVVCQLDGDPGPPGSAADGNCAARIRVDGQMQRPSHGS